MIKNILVLAQLLLTMAVHANSIIDAGKLTPENMRGIKPMFNDFSDNYGGLSFTKVGDDVKVFYNTSSYNKTQMNIDPVFYLEYDVRGL